MAALTQAQIAQEQTRKDAIQRALNKDVRTGMSTAADQQALLTKRDTQSANYMKGPQQGDRDIYQLQKEQIRMQGSQDAEVAKKKLNEQMASKGFGQGSGMLEATQAQQQQGMAVTQGQKLTDVEMKRLADESARFEAERGRQASATENDITNQINRDIQAGNLNQADRAAVIQATQFDSKMAFDEWAAQEGFDQQETNRIWQAGENTKSRAIQEKQLEQSATQFNTKMEFDRWAAQNNIDEANANRLWSTVENQKTRENQAAIATLENTFATGRLVLADQLAAAATATKIKTDAAYAKGKSGTVLTDAQLAAMSQAEKDAYEGGKAGKTYEDFSTDRDAKIAYREALILKLDPKSASFEDDLANVYTKLGIATGVVGEKTTVDPVTGLPVTTPPPVVKVDYNIEPVADTKRDYDTMGYEETDGNNQQNFQNPPPAVGEPIYIHGQKLTVASPIRTNYESYNEHQYFLVKDDVTGKTYQINPGGLPAKYYQGILTSDRWNTVWEDRKASQGTGNAAGGIAGAAKEAARRATEAAKKVTEAQRIAALQRATGITV